METGMKFNCEKLVEFKDSAAAIGSGAMEVFATPAMILLMESCCAKGVQPLLSDEQTTVGTVVNIRHLAATAIGRTVVCEAELIETDRARLVFKVACYCDGQCIGDGVHERFIVDRIKFMAKLKDKTENKQ